MLYVGVLQVGVLQLAGLPHDEAQLAIFRCDRCSLHDAHVHHVGISQHNLQGRPNSTRDHIADLVVKA